VAAGAPHPTSAAISTATRTANRYITEKRNRRPEQAECPPGPHGPLDLSALAADRRPVGVINRRNLDEPNETRSFPGGTGSVLRVGSLTIGRADLEPGWRWSKDVQPIAGTAYCEIHHLQLLLSGRFGVRMASGEEAELRSGDIFEVPRGHDAWVIGDEPVVILDFFGNIEDFALPVSPERVLATILMTDIVDSTATAERLGPAGWKQQLANHNRVIRGRLDRFGGREVKTTGDGFLATFTSALAAVRCAAAIADASEEIALPVRIGVHVGEIDLLPNDVGGVEVHTAARVMGLGNASEVIVSGATRSLVAGSGLSFEELGRRQLKGIEAPLEVFRLVR
jgi:class 3 adenylate cyclase